MSVVKSKVKIKQSHLVWCRNTLPRYRVSIHWAENLFVYFPCTDLEAEVLDYTARHQIQMSVNLQTVSTNLLFYF